MDWSWNSKGQKRKNIMEKICEEIMAENFSNLEKNKEHY